MSVEPAALSQIDAIGEPALRQGISFWTKTKSGAVGFLAIPAGIWARGITLFLILAGIKTALVFQFGKQLFETHWRVGIPETTIVGKIAFGLFVAFGAVSLFRLGQECQSKGVHSLRAVNLIVVGTGLCFLFLTFHEADNNYLFPILTGVLPWSSLGPYLSLDFCFRQPFLAGWLLAYVLGLYCLIRTEREKWSLHFTAAFSAAYAAVNLRTLSIFRDELLIVDTIALVCLILGWSAKSRVGWISWFAPLLWSSVLTVSMLRLAPNGMGLSFTYFLLLTAATFILFVGATLLVYARGCLQPWSRYLLFYASAFLLLTNSHHPIAPNFNRALAAGLEFPHYFMGELSVAAALILGGTILSKAVARAAFWCMDIVSVGCITIALVDLRLSQLLGTRLGWDVLALGGTPKMMWRMAKPYLPGAIGLLALLTVVYAVLVWGVRRWISRSNDSKNAQAVTEPVVSLSKTTRYALAYAAALFVGLGVSGLCIATPDKAVNQSGLHLIQTSPVWKRAFNRPMKREEFMAMARELKLGDFTAVPAQPSGSPRDLNLVMVFMESTYNEHLSLFGGSEQTQPLLSQYQDRMELFPNFFSNFASSIHARFATFTSLYPVRDYNEFTLTRVPVKSVFEVMHDNGYWCSLFYSSYLDFTGFRNFLANRGLDELHDADTMPGQRKTEPVSWGLREEETLEAMRGHLKARAADGKRFFLTYVPAAPHYPYEKVPERFRKFKIGDIDDCKPVYLNELLYMDWVITSLLDELRANGLLDKTLILITDDHGEMLGGKGAAVGHGWWLNPQLVNAPLIIMDPEKKNAAVNPVVGSQVDLLPTLLDVLRIPQSAAQLYQGRSLYRTRDPNRVSWLNSYQQYAVASQNSLVFGDRELKTPKAQIAGKSFRIVNEGTKTIFNEAAPLPLPASIQRFDSFQENLLRNYSYYSELLSAKQPEKLSLAR